MKRKANVLDSEENSDFLKKVKNNNFNYSEISSLSELEKAIIQSDGNYLFQVISHWINGSEKYHLGLTKEFCESMNENRSLFII